MDTKPTLGAAIHVKYIEFQDKIILLQIWDFGGEDKYRFLLPAYAYGTFGAVFMYDITKKDSLTRFEEWVSVFKSGLKNDVPILLVGGKRDLINNRVYFEENIEKILKSDLFFNAIECSAKTGENINKVFEILLEEIMKGVAII